MNQKKKPFNQSPVLIGVAIIAILAAAGVGYLIGNRGNSPDPGSHSAGTPEQAAALTTGALTPPPPAPQSKGLSPADLSKAKDVPASLPDPSGNYQLVAVIEGEEENRKLTSSLQIVGAQRQRLLGLSRQYDRLPAASIQQRELIAGEILKARQILTRNLQFMARNYGYSLQFNYRLIPHAASLFLITAGEDNAPAPKLVHQFKDATSYERFQKMRDDYLLLGVNEAKQAAAKATPGQTADAPAAPGNSLPAKPAASAPETPVAAPPEATDTTEAKPSPDPAPNSSPQSAISEPSPTLKAMQEQLIEEFNYDPTKNHQVNLEKTALYARSGNR